MVNSESAGDGWETHDWKTSTVQRHPSRSLERLSELNLATNIKSERLRRGWSQETLARLASEMGARLHQSSVAKIERTGPTRRPISVDEALVFSRLFGVSLYDMCATPEARSSQVVRHLERELEQANARAAVEAARQSELMRALAEERARLAASAEYGDRG